jgi:hypothetical protein
MGIIVGYVRAAGYAEYVEQRYKLFGSPNIPLVSIVSKGICLKVSLSLQARPN